MLPELTNVDDIPADPEDLPPLRPPPRSGPGRPGRDPTAEERWLEAVRWLRLVLFPLWFAWLVLAWSFGSAAASVERGLGMRDPRLTYDEDMARKRGAAFDEEGRMVAKQRPMRPSTVLLLYLRTTAAWYILFTFAWACFLAARYFAGLEAIPIRKYNQGVVFVVQPSEFVFRP